MPAPNRRYTPDREYLCRRHLAQARWFAWNKNRKSARRRWGPYTKAWKPQPLNGSY